MSIVRRTLTLLIIALILATSAAAASAQSIRVAVDPYAKVDWQHHQRHHGNFHSHTTQSDGRLSPAEVIDRYHAIGHDVLALTDHNKCTWPWTIFDRDPAKLGMVAVPGNELSRHHHTLSLFCDLTTDTRDLDTAIGQVDRSGGISVLAHPGRYWKLEEGKVPDEVTAKYVALFRKYDSLIGFEVINQGDRYPEDRALWDAVLTEMMPERPVWGMANDDSHTEAHIGLNTTVLLLPTHSSDAVRDALEHGRFYFTTVTSHPKQERDRKAVPVIRSIRHDAQAGTIEIKADCAGKPLDDQAFGWITAGGKVVHRGPRMDLTRTAGLSKYVRVEIRGTGGTAYTQPFGLSDTAAATADPTDEQNGFRFAQVCDTQFGTSGYDHDVATFEQAVRQINAMKLDFVVVCGDLVNKPTDRSFADFKKIKAKLTMPCYYVPGNHDVGNEPTADTLAKYRKTMGKDYFSFEYKAHLFVCVNSSLWKAPIADETEKQDAWLEETLATAAKKKMPVFVVAHYPLYVKQPDEAETYSNLPIATRQALLELFKASGVVAVLTGHAHRIIVNDYQGIQMVSGEATSKTHGSPLGFRVWHIHGSPPFKHKSVTLEAPTK